MDTAIYIGDDPFKISYMEYDVDRYDEFLKNKINKVLALLSISNTMQISKVDVIKSPVRHFRHRCRFAVMPRSISSEIDTIGVVSSRSKISATHQIDCIGATCDTSLGIYSTNNDVKSPTAIDLHQRGESNLLSGQDAVRLTYSLWENGGPNINVISFPIASISIYNAMPVLLAYVQRVSELHTDLRAVNFLSTLSGELIATLVYGNELTSNWEEKAIEMHSKLGWFDVFLSLAEPLICVEFVSFTSPLYVLCVTNSSTHRKDYSGREEIGYNREVSWCVLCGKIQQSGGNTSPIRRQRVEVRTGGERF